MNIKKVYNARKKDLEDLAKKTISLIYSTTVVYVTYVLLKHLFIGLLIL